jgi:hypothetical protein
MEGSNGERIQSFDDRTIDQKLRITRHSHFGEITVRLNDNCRAKARRSGANFLALMLVLSSPSKGESPMDDRELNSALDIESDEAQEARLDAEAMAAARAGRVVPHERVREWLVKLANGERAPRPRS